MKKLILIFIIIIIFPSFLPAKDFNRGKLPKVANPDWVYPSNRKNYDGYEKKKAEAAKQP